MTSTIAVIDFETTGLNPSNGDRPTEVAVVFVRNQKIVGQFQSLTNPGRSIPSYVTSLTGITNEMARNAPPVETVMEELYEKIGSIPLIAHNASFDRKFLDTELVRIGKRRRQDLICSMRVARRVLMNASNFKLGTLVEHIGLAFPGNAHRALADAEMTAKLWAAMEQTVKLKFGLEEVPLNLLERLQSVTIANADEYIRNYARNINLRRGKISTPGQSRTSRDASIGPGRTAWNSSTDTDSSPRTFDSTEVVKCITCGYEVSVTQFDGIRWLKCPCCGFNTPQRYNG